MHRSTNLAILVVAVILGVFAAFLARSWLQSHSTGTDGQKTVPILVATDTLAFGAPIGAKDVREIDWPAQSSPEGPAPTISIEASLVGGANTSGCQSRRHSSPAVGF